MSKTVVKNNSTIVKKYKNGSTGTFNKVCGKWKKSGGSSSSKKK